MAFIQWLNDLPFWATILIMVGGPVALSLLGTIIAQGFFGERQLSLNNVIGGFKYMFLSQIYAGFIGFLLYGVYNRYDEMRSTVVQEVEVLQTLDNLAEGFPMATRDQLRGALKTYALQVAEVEWPQLRARSANPLTNASFDTLFYTYQAVEPVTVKQQIILDRSKDLLESIRDKRGARVLRSLGMQILLWGVSLTATAVAIVLPWVFGAPNLNADLAMSALSVVVMALVLLVILKLSYPFGGAEGIQPTPYLTFAQAISARGG